MQASNKRRVVLYGTAALTLTGLVYGGFVYRSRADVPTLLSCAQPQLALGLHEHAEPFVLDALEQDPENFEGLAMLAAIHERRGRRADALAIYRRLLPRSEAVGMRAELEVAIARLALEGGDAAAALAELDAVRSEDRDTRWKKAVLRARCLHALGRTEELEAAVAEVEVLSGPEWSSRKLRSELGMPVAEPAGASLDAKEGAETSSTLQGAGAGGR
jgi:tetratricopeptide (TPR) repeat protein